MSDLEVRFCAAPDGTRIAYAKYGAGPGRTLILVESWAFPLEATWDNPEGQTNLNALDRPVVVFDRRGTGISSREVADISLDAQVGDVLTIMGDMKLEEVDLFGFGDGSAISIAVAAKFPRRVARMVLWGAFVRGTEVARDTAMQGLVQMVETDWALARRTLAAISLPSATLEAQKTWSAALRDAVSPSMAGRHLKFLSQIDLSSLLGNVQCRTLVLNRREELTPLKGARAVAAGIPNARLIVVEGGDFTFGSEISRLLQLAREFLDGGIVTAAQPSRAFRAVLFTDLVGHSEMMSRLGDERGREVLREHERITREVLKAHGGTEVKTMGDGFMASFGSVTKAVECAVALQRAIGNRQSAIGEQMAVRIGLNAGEPIEEEGDLFGATVILASRIAAKAEGGEILCSDVVRGLCAGKGFSFLDRGEFVAKGFEEPVRVYEARWRE